MISIGGISIQGLVSQFVTENRQRGEEAVTSQIKEAIENPTRNLKEIQQPSPLSQFLDIKI